MLIKNSSDPKIPVSTESYWQDPYTVLASFQERFRCAYTDKGVLAVLHWDDAVWALKGEDFINEGIEMLEDRGFKPGDPLHTWRSNALGIMNGEQHRRIRKLVGRAMSRQSIEPLRPKVRETALKVLAGIPKGEVVDLLPAFTSPIPRLVMMQYLGISQDELDAAEKPLSEAGIADCFGPRVTQEMRDRANSAIDIVMRRVEMLYESRRVSPREDLLTYLLNVRENDEALTGPELITLFSTIFGSGATTANSLAAAVLELARNPDQAQILQSDLERYKRGATEESLRFHPGIVELPQKASRNMEAFGFDFEKGDKIVVPFGAVNRDPQRWERPQEFDITRDPEVASLTFGIGPHFCLGQAMARVTIEECLGILFGKYSRIELVETPRWKPFVMEAKLESLKVILHA